MSLAREEAAPAPDGTLAGIGWMLLSTLFFVGVTGIVRHVGTDIPSVEAAFIRYAAGLLMVLPLMTPLLRKLPPAPVLRIYAVRGVLHGFAVMLWFYAMARIPIAEVTAIGYTAPIFVTLGAALFFREALHLRRLIAIAIGFMGTLIILRPGIAEVSSGHLAQLAAAPFFAASYLMAKRLTWGESTGVIVGMLSLGCTITLLPGALLVWETPTFAEVGWLSLTALVATLGHYAQTRAFRAAPLTVTQPIVFLQLIWASTLGITLFDEPVDPFVLLGGGIVVAAVTYISHREAQAARQLRTPTAIATKM